MFYGWRNMEEHMLEATVSVSGYAAWEAICRAFYAYATENPGVFSAMLWYNKYRNDETQRVTERLFPTMFQITAALGTGCDQTVYGASGIDFGSASAQSEDVQYDKDKVKEIYSANAAKMFVWADKMYLYDLTTGLVAAEAAAENLYDRKTKKVDRLMVMEMQTGAQKIHTLKTVKESGTVYGSDQGVYFATATLDDDLKVRVYDTATGTLIKEETITVTDPLYVARIPEIIISDHLKTCIVVLGNRQPMKTMVKSFQF